LGLWSEIGQCQIIGSIVGQSFFRLFIAEHISVVSGVGGRLQPKAIVLQRCTMQKYLLPPKAEMPREWTNSRQQNMDL